MSQRQAGWSKTKLRAGPRAPDVARETRASAQEKAVTKRTWWWGVISCPPRYRRPRYRRSWKVEVNPSKPRYAAMRAPPHAALPPPEEAPVDTSTVAADSPETRNRVQPEVTRAAKAYSDGVYRLRSIVAPHSITGTVFAVFASVCTGKLTCLGVGGKGRGTLERKSARLGWPAEGCRKGGGSLEGLVLAGRGHDIGEGHQGVGGDRGEWADSLPLDQVGRQRSETRQQPVQEHDEQGVLEVVAVPAMPFDPEKGEEGGVCRQSGWESREEIIIMKLERGTKAHRRVSS